MAIGAHAITDEEVERSLLDHISKNITDGVSIHEPGMTFSPERHKEWIEPRISTLDHDPTSRPGEEFARMDLTVRCFIKVEQKGERKLELSILVDKVLNVVGGERNVAAGIILQEDKTDVGRLQFGTSSQSRAYGVAVVIASVSYVGLDVATIVIPTLVTGDP